MNTQANQNPSPGEKRTAAGYVTDVQYTADFYIHTAPAWMAYIAAINGHAAPWLDAPFTWCDLGCGRGVTGLLLAATHPEGKFYGCDLNAEHIAFAERARGTAGAANAHFRAQGFADFQREDLPQFDFITLHGVYGWVPAIARAEIRDFLRAKLRPGGLAMVSYNTMPGWANLLPLRRLLHDFGRQAEGDSLQKAKAAYARALALADAKAGYFAAAPAADAHLREMAKQDIRYIAHEYMTPVGEAFYFADLAGEMAQAGLHFAGSMDPADNYPELTLPPRFHALIPPGSGRGQLESMRDFVFNTRFRRDLYVRAAPAPMPEDLGFGAFDGLAFCLTDLPERLPLKQSDGNLSFDLTAQQAQVRALDGLLSSGPKSARELGRALAGFSEADACFLIQQLVVSRRIAPCAGARPAAGWPAAGSAMLQAALEEHWPEVPLPCPASGSALYCEIPQALVLREAKEQGDAGAAARRVLEALRKTGYPVRRHEADGTQRAASDDDILDYATAALRGFRSGDSADARLVRLHGLAS